MLLPIYNFCHGQNSLIYGSVNRVQDNLIAQDIKILLLDSTQNKIDSCKSDSLGNYQFTNINKGSYCLKVLDTIPKMVINIDVIGNDTLNFNFLTYKPCKTNNMEGDCPRCKRKDKVLITENGLVILNHFISERAAKKDWKRIQRKGYESYFRNDSIEVVYNVFIKDQKDNFENPCYRWFCIRDKIIF